MMEIVMAGKFCQGQRQNLEPICDRRDGHRSNNATFCVVNQIEDGDYDTPGSA